MALPLWRLPTPFTRVYTSKSHRNQRPKAHRFLLTAPGLPQTGSWQSLDDTTLENLTYLNVILPVQTWELQEHFGDIESARRQLERLYSSKTASTGKTDNSRYVATGIGPVTEMSVRVKKPPTSVAEPGSPDDERDQAAVNRGEAFRILREDVPNFFRRDWNYSIYTDNVVLIDVYKRQCSGLQSYKTVFRGLRALGNLLFRHIELRLVNIRQAGPANQDIVVKWQVVGTPFWSLNGEANRWDGSSTFKFDSKGRVSTHIIDDKTFAKMWQNVSVWSYIAELLSPAPEASGRLCPNWVPGPALGAAVAAWGSSNMENMEIAKRTLQDVWQTLNTPPLLRQQVALSIPGSILMPSQG
eukprot:jgi/Botrbrau1/2129/Bobra.0093s0036.1